MSIFQPYIDCVSTDTVSNVNGIFPETVVDLLGLKPNLTQLSEWIRHHEQILLNPDKFKEDPDGRTSFILSTPDGLPESFDPSLIQKQTKVMTSDIGGTNLRIRKGHIDPVSHKPKIDSDYDENLDEECENLRAGHEFEDFLRIVARHFVSNGLKSGDAVVLGLSYPFEPYELEPNAEVTGTGARLINVESIQKEALFLKRSMAVQLNGLSVDKLFLRILKEEHSVVPSSIRIVNDTSSVGFAYPAHGGTVGSTGGNFTYWKVEKLSDGSFKRERCVSEGGAFFKLVPEVLGIAEQEMGEAYFEETKRRDPNHRGIYLAFESICSGKFLPTYLDANIRYLAGRVPCFSHKLALDWYMESQELGDPALISALANSDDKTLRDSFPDTYRLIEADTETWYYLKEISQAIMTRAGVFFGIMNYYSVFALLHYGLEEHVEVNVDSSVAKSSPHYKKALIETFDALTGGKGNLNFSDETSPVSLVLRGNLNLGSMQG